MTARPPGVYMPLKIAELCRSMKESGTSHAQERVFFFAGSGWKSKLFCPHAQVVCVVRFVGKIQGKPVGCGPTAFAGFS